MSKKPIDARKILDELKKSILQSSVAEKSELAEELETTFTLTMDSFEIIGDDDLTAQTEQRHRPQKSFVNAEFPAPHSFGEYLSDVESISLLIAIHNVLIRPVQIYNTSMGLLGKSEVFAAMVGNDFTFTSNRLPVNLESFERLGNRMFPDTFNIKDFK